ncbi:MAG: 50S ribosomal protein L11 methyltransferase [Alphaproteobacteria bacterium]|nr:50S ribosomal protein L11 methyltransferase [Alphaproteobacteria bacterium]
MIKKIFKCTIGVFSIVDSFTIVDLLFEQNYMSVSCVEKQNNRWYVEVLSAQPIKEFEIARILADYKYSFFETEILENIDWLEKCFENFKPITVGNFYMFGPHLRMKKHPANKIAIEVAAATAFGSGEHPTTNRCLLASQVFFDPKIHKKVLDIGCGSGILSIALAKLGCRYVTACDNDSEAVRITMENIAINHVAHRVMAFQNYAHEFDKNQYDFIVANILASPLISMAESVTSCLNKNGILVLSGFNSGDNSVLQKYTSLGMKEKYIYDYKDWTTIVLQKA